MRQLVRSALIGTACLFVGAVTLVGNSPVGGTTVPATVAAASWTAATLPVAPGNAGLSDISCVNASFCAAVGGNATQTLIEQWNGTAWSIVASPNVAGASTTYLSAVSCVSPTFCMALGNSLTGTTTFASLTEEWNGTAWSIVASPTPSPSVFFQFNAVSCTGPSFCVGVGDYDPTSSDEITVIEQWNGTAWSIVPSPNVAGVTNDLYGVSCTGTSSCTAVGHSISASVFVTLVEMWNGTAWSIATSPQPTTSTGAVLEDVSCIGASFCTAVGYYDTAPFVEHTLVESWTGTVWSIIASPDGSGQNSELKGVNCFSATSCSAVGLGANNAFTAETSLALVWDGSTWRVVSSPNAPTVPETYLVAVGCISNWQCVATGGSVNGSSIGQPFIMSAPIARSGYRFVASDGGIFAFGSGAPFLGSTGAIMLNKPIVGMGVMPAGDGYYLVASDGGVFTFGSAQFYGSTGSIHLNKPIVGMAVTADGGGYWLVASDGGIFAFGDARFYGSTGALTLNKPIVGMASTPNGLGYYLVASDGGIFAFGNAVFAGSAGALKLNKPIVGMAETLSGGYYLVASDGGIFTFPASGGPPFLGSTGALKLNKPIVGMTIVAGGYYLAASDGGIFTFPPSGGPPFLGSTGAIVLNKPIVGVAS